MSLATRLSGFFLAALALALGGFSITLYLLARSHFQRDLDERLVTALDILVGGGRRRAGKGRVGTGGAPMVVSAPSQEDPVRWAVSDGQAKVLEDSWKDLDHDDLQTDPGAEPGVRPHSRLIHRPRRQALAAGGAAHSVGLAIIRSRPDRHEHGESLTAAGVARRAPVGRAISNASLILAAGAHSEPMEASLRNAALTLAGLSVGIWLLAALVGRRLCDRALLPVTRMARAACSMTAVDRDQRLPSPATGDELDALANSFNGLLDRLHQEFERQKRFTGDASHQLRTPLTALLGQLEVARRRDRTVAEYQRVLDDVRGEAVKLCQIVEALLFMARAETEAGRPDLQPARAGLVDPRPPERVVEPPAKRRSSHRDRARQLRHGFAVHSPLLGQLLDNLLDNACKYSAPGTPIVVRLWREGEHGARWPCKTMDSA